MKTLKTYYITSPVLIAGKVSGEVELEVKGYDEEAAIINAKHEMTKFSFGDPVVMEEYDPEVAEDIGGLIADMLEGGQS